MGVVERGKMSWGEEAVGGDVGSKRERVRVVVVLLWWWLLLLKVLKVLLWLL